MNIILRNTKDPIFFEVHPENRKVNVKQNAFEKMSHSDYIVH